MVKRGRAKQAKLELEEPLKGKTRLAKKMEVHMHMHMHEAHAMWRRKHTIYTRIFNLVL